MKSFEYHDNAACRSSAWSNSSSQLSQGGPVTMKIMPRWLVDRGVLIMLDTPLYNISDRGKGTLAAILFINFKHLRWGEGGGGILFQEPVNNVNANFRTPVFVRVIHFFPKAESFNNIFVCISHSDI